MAMSDPTFLIFPRPEAEAGNLAPLLRRFGPDKRPKGKNLAAMMSTFHFAVDGYDDDPHEVYAIAPARRFYQKLHREWPYAFFFCDLRGESLMMLTMCCLDNLDGTTKAGEALSQVQIDPRELLQFIMKGWAPMNEMCERAGFSERAIMSGRTQSWVSMGCHLMCRHPGEWEEGGAAARRVKLRASEVCR